MVPIVLNTTRTVMAVAGEGELALKRIRFLKAHGAEPAAVFAPEPAVELAAEAGGALIRRWPGPEDLKAVHVLFAAGLDAEDEAELAWSAREAKVLLNIEDVIEHCDFHVPATVRRGDLLLTASTGGRAPGLARRLGVWLGAAFGPEWEGRLEAIASARRDWKAAGVTGAALGAATDRMIDEKGWLR